MLYRNNHNLPKWVIFAIQNNLNWGPFTLAKYTTLSSGKNDHSINGAMTISIMTLSIMTYNKIIKMWHSG